MDQQEIARQVIRHFKSLQKNPLPSDQEIVGSRLFRYYLAGFDQACRIFGFDLRDPFIEEGVIVDKGLKMTPFKSPLQQLQERGLDNKVIMNELLDIQIETVRRAYGITDE